MVMDEIRISFTRRQRLALKGLVRSEVRALRKRIVRTELADPGGQSVPRSLNYIDDLKLLGVLEEILVRIETSDVQAAVAEP